MRTRLLLVLITANLLHADERTQRLVTRLAEEAAVFERIAPQVLGTETLVQRAIKRPGGFKLRIGASAQRSREPEWQERTLVSEYGFAVFSSGNSSGESLHELRRVTSVDGKKVAAKSGSEDLVKVITATDDARKRALLKQFEKYGLLGAANDFGQLILLFSRSNIGQYEFDYRYRASLDNSAMVVFSYRQIDGRNPLTVFNLRQGNTTDVGVRGEVWVREDNYAPVRITLVAEPDADANGKGIVSDSDQSVRQEASVDYVRSLFGAMLPVATYHSERQGGTIVVQNTFTYQNFKRFGASSAIQFEGEPGNSPVQ